MNHATEASLVCKVNTFGETAWQFVEMTDTENNNPSDDEVQPNCTINSNTNENKKKKKKKKKNRTIKAPGIESKNSSKKCISWGLVEEITFSRDIALDVIPSKGYLPLGLGELEGREIYSLEDYLKYRESDLAERAHTRISPNNCMEYNYLETRQFDYREGVNPLFHATDETDR